MDPGLHAVDVIFQQLQVAISGILMQKRPHLAVEA